MNRYEIGYGKLLVLGDIAQVLLSDAEWNYSDDEELVDAYNKLMASYQKAQDILHKRTTKDAAE